MAERRAAPGGQSGIGILDDLVDHPEDLHLQRFIFGDGLQDEISIGQFPDIRRQAQMTQGS